MEVRQLKYFCAIAEEGQISRAAERLHISQPPLSYHLKLLEDELGVKLVERNTRFLSLTQAGRVFYQRAQHILGLMKGLSDEVKDIEFGVSGLLAIGSPPAIGSLYIPDKILEFHRKWPAVRFEWRGGNTFRVLELLAHDVVEFGIVRLPVPAGAYEVRPIRTDTWIAVSRRDDPVWRDRTEVSLDELGGIPLVLMHRQEGIFCHDMVIDRMRERNIPAEIVCECDQIVSVLALVERGMGIALLPESTLALRPEADFHRMAIEGGSIVSQSAIIWKKDRRLSRAARLFLQMFGEDFPAGTDYAV